ncbi:hypothetical protein ACFLX1_00150 [Chloroflexota bacterium]
MPTTQISLIRRHTEIIKPPRALWVSFELGRPLGMPNAPAFQKRVLLAALKLLEAPSGPLLEDFPDDAPASTDEITMLACPVNFVQDGADFTKTEQLCAAFKREMVSMRPWYDIAVGKHERTTVGASRIGLDAIDDFICSFLKGVEPKNPRDDISLAYTLKFAVDDLKAYYFEGITAQPNQESTSSQILLDWFWEETVAGKVLLAIREAYKKSEDSEMRIVGGRLIVPSKVARSKTK